MSFYETYIKAEIVSESTPNFDPEGCTSISFENLGTDDATINGSIPLNANDPGRDFNYLPNQYIKQPFSIAFAGAAATTQKILIIKTFTRLATNKEWCNRS